MITSLLNGQTLLDDVACDSWQELVDVAGAPLVRQGSVEPVFLQSIKDTIERYGAYMVLVDDIALLHARPEAGVHEVAMSLALLRRPVYLQDKRVKAAFVFAAVDQNSHLGLLKELAAILTDDEFLDLLRTGGSGEDVLRHLEVVEQTLATVDVTPS